MVATAAESLAEPAALTEAGDGDGFVDDTVARDAVRRGLATSLEQGLEIEADLNTLAFQTADSVEGIAAFLEKRKPVFRGS